MSIAHVLQFNPSLFVGKSIVPPAGSKTLVFFGTGGDGLETNRIVGGPALVASGTPVHSANFVSVGHQPVGAPTRFDSIDTGNVMDAAGFAAGFTWACVSRTGGEGTDYNQCMSNMTTATGQGFNVDSLSLQASANRLVNAGGVANRGTLNLVNSVITTWHFIAMTCTGGATPTITAYEFTENQAGQAAPVYSPTARALPSGSASPHFGCLSVEGSSLIGPSDTAFGFVASGAMSQVNLAALAASVRPWLASRGIVM